MTFSYAALAPDGTLNRGRGEFHHLQDLMNHLESRELILLKYRAQRLPSLERLLDMFQPRVERVDIVEFCDSLATMIGSGIPLVQSLEDLRDTCRVKRLRRALEKVLTEVHHGEQLSVAFEKQAGVFPDIMVFFCNIGEETGTMSEALRNTADHLRRVEDIVSQTRRALIYPSFVISAMGAVLIFWLFFVMPRLVATFHDMDLQLPDVTLTLVAFVAMVKNSWHLLLAGLGALVALAIFLSRYERTRAVFATLLFKIPVLGTLLKYSTLTIFFSNLSLMLRSGVTMTRSFEVLEATLANPALKRIVTRIRQATTEGDSLCDAFAASRFFDALSLRMISVGESTGTLDQRLSSLADTYHERTTRFVDIMGKLVEPLVMAIAGGIFVFIVISLIGPVYDLISQLGGG